ncbi:hypothetical protein ENBRE01_0152 [Enteropsectra breve]|nr:hypothetical protein ENBRE01_0152 [Enteropsectra breve]
MSIKHNSDSSSESGVFTNYDDAVHATNKINSEAPTADATDPYATNRLLINHPQEEYYTQHSTPAAVKTGPSSRKTTMEYIVPKTKRSVTFSKRKRGLMKKAHELSILTGAQILVVVASECGHIFTYSTDKLKPLLYRKEEFIHNCLKANPKPKRGDMYGKRPSYYYDDDDLFFNE